MTAPVPETGIGLVDLTAWRSGDPDVRAAFAAAVDEALQRTGFLLVTGHGVPAEAPARLRAAARTFFALPDDVKQAYAVSVGGRGWLPIGAEANGYAEGTPTPPDLKESFSFGHDTPTGDPAVDAAWFPPNVWPAEVPALRSEATAYLARLDALADELMAVCAVALGQQEDFFAGCTRNPTSSININRYPARAEVGPPEPGQYRIGPHTDFGTVTLLDRQSGKGGLQVCTAAGAWVDAPFVPGSLTVNIGDLLALWSGHRWRSGRHRVLPPDPTVPQEELTSLVYFGEVDVDTPVEPLAWPGVPTPEPVLSHVYLRAKLDAISIG